MCSQHLRNSLTKHNFWYFFLLAPLKSSEARKGECMSVPDNKHLLISRTCCCGSSLSIYRKFIVDVVAFPFCCWSLPSDKTKRSTFSVSDYDDGYCERRGGDVGLFFYLFLSCSAASLIIVPVHWSRSLLGNPPPLLPFNKVEVDDSLSQWGNS